MSNQSMGSSHGSDWSIRERRKKQGDNGREGRIISIDLIYQSYFSFISLPMMNQFVCISLLFLCFVGVNDAKKPNDPLQGRLDFAY